MGRFVIAVYKPKPGKDGALAAAVAKHHGVLRAEGLVTERQPCVMRASDGSTVEIFEWSSAEAVERAHSNPTVGRLWAEFGEACDWVPLGTLPESQAMFAEFEAA